MQTDKDLSGSAVCSFLQNSILDLYIAQRSNMAPSNDPDSSIEKQPSVEHHSGPKSGFVPSDEERPQWESVASSESEGPPVVDDSSPSDSDVCH